MTWRLSGHTVYPAYAEQMKKYGWKNLAVVVDKLGESSLDLAKSNLANLTFGLTENFADTLTLIMRHVFPNCVLDEREQDVIVGKISNRPTVEDMPENILEELQKSNSKDLELFLFAVKQFDERVSHIKDDYL